MHGKRYTSFPNLSPNRIVSVANSTESVPNRTDSDMRFRTNSDSVRVRFLIRFEYGGKRYGSLKYGYGTVQFIYGSKQEWLSTVRSSTSTIRYGTVFFEYGSDSVRFGFGTIRYGIGAVRFRFGDKFGERGVGVKLGPTVLVLYGEFSL